MCLCDKRLEVRLPGLEKDAAESMAEIKGITVSELLRRALRAYASLPEPLSGEDRMSVAGLRRRINAIESRVEAGDITGLAADLMQARAEAKALMGR